MRGGKPSEDKMKFFDFIKIRKEIERQEEIIRLKKEIIKNNIRTIEAKLALIEQMQKFFEQAKRYTP
jgi:hypothetical protein